MAISLEAVTQQLPQLEAMCMQLYTAQVGWFVLWRAGANKRERLSFLKEGVSCSSRDPSFYPIATPRRPPARGGRPASTRRDASSAPGRAFH